MVHSDALFTAPESESIQPHRSGTDAYAESAVPHDGADEPLVVDCCSDVAGDDYPGQWQPSAAGSGKDDEAAGGPSCASAASPGVFMTFDRLVVSCTDVESDAFAAVLSPQGAFMGRGASAMVRSASMSFQATPRHSAIVTSTAGTGTARGSPIVVEEHPAPPLTGPLCPDGDVSDGAAATSLEESRDDAAADSESGLCHFSPDAAQQRRLEVPATADTALATSSSSSQRSPSTTSASVPVAVKTIPEKDATRRYAASCELAFFRRYQTREGGSPEALTSPLPAAAAAARRLVGRMLAHGARVRITGVPDRAR
jgi:hypothetical protein